MSSRFSLDGLVAVVTGSCGKLGPIWAEALLEAGARVAALDLPGARPSPAFVVLTERFASAVHRVDCDITSRASIEAAAQAVEKRLGVPSVLVSNARHRSGARQPWRPPSPRHAADRRVPRRW